MEAAPTDPARHSHPWTLVVVGFVVASAVAGAVALGSGAGGRDVVVAELAAFVSDARGLDFVEPVPVTLLDDAAYAERVSQVDVDTIDKTSIVLRSVGLLDDGVDLVAVYRQLNASSKGVYFHDTGEIFIRGSAMTPAARMTVVHELVHALDDQHFDFGRTELSNDGDAAAAFRTIVEGNAARIAAAYYATLDVTDRRAVAVAAATSDIAMRRVPRALLELSGFPYRHGPTVVAALLAAGGEARLNDALSAPPTNTEQVLDPHAWLLDGEPPVRVTRPPADATTIAEGVFGQRVLTLLLTHGPDPGGAIEASAGWGGSRYVAWRQGDEACLRATIAMDTANDLEELANALAHWATDAQDASIDRSLQHITLRSCA
jgi:hypothetical protein